MGRTGETDSGNCCVCVLGPQEVAKKLPLEKTFKRQLLSVIDATGFEPAASASLTQRSTKLSHASRT